MSACRGCGAPILWVRTTHGNLMPLDAEPDPDGNVELVDRDGQAVTDPTDQRALTAVVHAQPSMLGGRRWMPHHATCPEADQFRGQP